MPLPFPFPTGDAGAVFAFLGCGRVGAGAEWVPEASAVAFVGEKERAEEEAEEGAEEKGAEEAERSVGSGVLAAARGPRSGASQRAACRPAL